MTYYNRVMAGDWVLRKRADKEQKSLRTECETLQLGNQALRETAKMLSREVEDTYKDLEATEVERDGIQRKLQEQDAENREQKEKTFERSNVRVSSS